MRFQIFLILVDQGLHAVRDRLLNEFLKAVQQETVIVMVAGSRVFRLFFAVGSRGVLFVGHPWVVDRRRLASEMVQSLVLIEQGEHVV